MTGGSYWSLSRLSDDAIERAVASAIRQTMDLRSNGLAQQLQLGLAERIDAPVVISALSAAVTGAARAQAWL